MNIAVRCRMHSAWSLAVTVTVAVAVTLAGCAQMGRQGSVEPELSQSSSDISGSGDARNRARANTELAALYFERGNLGVALEVLRTAAAADPTYAPVHGMFGLVYMNLRENVLAQQSFERALRYAPNDADINHNYGWFLCQTGKEEQATRYFLQAVRNPLYPTPWKSYSAAGECALKKDNLKDASEFFGQALKVDPDEPTALLKLAGIQYRAGQMEEARRLIGRYNKGDAPDPEGLWLGIRIERKAGNKALENSYANQLRRRFPDSPEYQRMQRGKYD